MSPQPRQQLVELVARYGRELAEDPRRCEALLRDYCSEYKREITLLVSAARERVAAELWAGRDSVPAATLLARLTRRLYDNLGIAEGFARWAVESWALALGVIADPTADTGTESPAEAPGVVLEPPIEAPGVALEPPIEAPGVATVHGESKTRVRALQQQVAAVLGVPVLFRDRLADGGQGPMLSVIPPGCFLMGSPEDEPGRFPDERPHWVTIERAFAIGRYAVTFAEYDPFVTATGQGPPADEGWGRDLHPVINVNWWEALAYADWLSQQTGHRYRLPTEAEWEYAARAGTATPFHCGEMITPSQARFEEVTTLPVGRFPANAWGLHDIHGNVWEWTCSEYDAAYGGGELECVAADRTAGRRVLRGGAARENLPRCLRSSFRVRLPPDSRDSRSGFRVVREL
jgi:formylglycine-generating enzyme required for sulfatase activity